MNRQAGLTLVELMIALALGLLLSAGIVSIYIQSKDSFWQDEEIARVQENGRYGIQLLSRELQMAGFYGGLQSSFGVNTLSVTGDCGSNWATTLEPTFEVVNNATGTIGSSYNCIDTNGFVEGTDVLAVKRVSDTPIIENGAWMNGYSSLKGERIYLRSNNRGLAGGVFAKGSDLNTTPGGGIVAGSGNPASNPEDGTGVDIWEYYVSLFHIAEDTDGMPALARYRLNSAGQISDREILVRGVEDMQVLLGTDSETDRNGIPNRFHSDDTAPPVSGGLDPNEIVAVKVYLLVRSSDAVVARGQAVTYQLGSELPVTKDDGAYRRVFSNTVMLRNSIFRFD